MTDPLYAELRRLSAMVDPVPDHVRAAAEAAGALVTPDWDWLDTLTDTVLVRAGAPRQLSLGRAGVPVLELELHRGADLLVTGLLLDGPALVEVRWAGGAVPADTDDTGCFRAAGLPLAPLRVVVRRPDERALATRWLCPWPPR
jgi:hypothetical protein